MTPNESLFVTLLALSTLLLASGCGVEALRINADIARGMLEVQSSSGPAIRRARMNAAIEAGRQAHANGLPESAAQLAAEHVADQWQCAIDGHSIYALGVGAYIDALALWQSGDGFSLAGVIPFVSRAVDSYRFLASCLTGLGSSILPEIPDFFRLIPPVWDVR